MKRSKQLPFGGDLPEDEMQHLGERLDEAVEFAEGPRHNHGFRQGGGRSLLRTVRRPPRIVGRRYARAEAQVVRSP